MTVAQRLSAYKTLERKGQTIAHVREGTATYNPATGSTSMSGGFTQHGKGVILPFGVGVRFSTGTSITAADRQCLLSGLKTDGSAMAPPFVSDKITDAAGKVYTVMDVADLDPESEADIIFEMVVRSGS